MVHPFFFKKENQHLMTLKGVRNYLDEPSSTTKIAGSFWWPVFAVFPFFTSETVHCNVLLIAQIKRLDILSKTFSCYIPPSQTVEGETKRQAIHFFCGKVGGRGGTTLLSIVNTWHLTSSTFEGWRGVWVGPEGWYLGHSHKARIILKLKLHYQIWKFWQLFNCRSLAPCKLYEQKKLNWKDWP